MRISSELYSRRPRAVIRKGNLTPSFLTIFRWQVVRNALRHPLLGALNIFSVALGIAVFLAIQIANRSANQSFAAGVDLVAGKAHLELRGEVDEALWPGIASHPRVEATTAVVEGVLTLPDFPGEYLKVLGVDLFTSEPFRTFEIGDGNTSKHAFSLESWLGTANGLAVTDAFARANSLRPGDKLRVVANTTEHEAVILSIIPPDDSPSAVQQRFAAMDLGWAQELFGMQGKLSSIQVRVTDPLAGPGVAEELRTLVSPDVQVAAPRQRSFQIETMLSAFQLNLTALSMVSLLVGTFLIYNTISASVARRRTEVGILRALGASRWHVRALFLGEACVLAAIGIALGAGGGVALGHLLLGAVAKTISSLYLLLSIDRLFLHPWQFAFAAVLGFGAVIVGAWKPADEAARMDPVGALSTGSYVERSVAQPCKVPWLAFVSLGLALLSSALALTAGPAMLSFAAAFFVLVTCASCAPAATVLMSRVAGGWGGAPVAWRLGADYLGRSVHRNGVTVAAMASAIGMAIGLLIMIFSFRETVSAWVTQSIVADLFIAPASNETVGLAASIPAAAVEWLERRPEVEAVDSFREQEVQVETGSGIEPVLMAVVKGSPRDNVQFVGGGSETKLRQVFAGETVGISESLSRRLRITTGDLINVRTPRGVAAISVAGVYADYSRDQGVILIEAGHFARYFGDAPAQSLAVYLNANADSGKLSESFHRQFSRGGEFVSYSNKTLRERIFNIFDQTFSVTYVLRTVAIFVAILGVFLSVTTLVAERERELGVLRAIGASTGQVQRLFMSEAAMIGLVSSLLGILAGSLLAAVLTWVVNPAFFGWTIRLQIPWLAVLATPLWIVPAAMGAAWYPAWSASQKPVAAAVREE